MLKIAVGRILIGRYCTFNINYFVIDLINENNNLCRIFLSYLLNLHQGINYFEGNL